MTLKYDVKGAVLHLSKVCDNLFTNMFCQADLVLGPISADYSLHAGNLVVTS